MEFNEALQKSLKADKHTRTDPFLLHSRVSDLVGNNYEAKKAAKEFYRLDAKYEISKTILAAVPQPKRRKCKKHTYKILPITPPPDNAYVFFTNDSPTIHISGECPCLKNRTVFRTTYDYARYRDYLKHRNIHSLKSRWSRRIAKYHTPQICRRCGSFTPTYPRTLIEKLRAFLYDMFGVGSTIQCVSVPFQEFNIT
jgi:hypothetical protein